MRDRARAESPLRSARDRAASAICWAALAAALGVVFASQSADYGFEGGHRGWVSAHTLAIAEKATADSGFVGYTLALRTPDSRELYYFDRYPVFFSLLLHAVQAPVRPDKAAQIAVARQLMNVVYALTVLAAVLLLVELGLPLGLAVAASALAAAGYTMVEFRDMVHFDQPALLGMLVLLRAIVVRENGGRSLPAYAATVFAVCAGRGYASFAVLGLWGILDAFRLLRALPLREAVPGIARGLPARCCLLSIAVAASCIAYNVSTEARLRDVSWKETSILGSATRRLAIDESYNESKSGRLGALHFLDIQQNNLARSLVPWSRGLPFYRQSGLRVLTAIAASLVAVVFVATREPRRRGLWLVVLLCGPAWLFAMRNLSAFHPYTAMYLFPSGLVIFSALLLLPMRLRTLSIAVPVAACALLAYATVERNGELRRNRRSIVTETTDMQRIADRLPPGESFAADRRLFRGVPFALGFFLPGRDIVVEGASSLLVTRIRDFPGELLTPDNEMIFLVRTGKPYKGKTPLARLHAGSRMNRLRSERSAPRGLVSPGEEP